MRHRGAALGVQGQKRVQLAAEATLWPAPRAATSGYRPTPTKSPLQRADSLAGSQRDPPSRRLYPCED
jgi:hypothetical protein